MNRISLFSTGPRQHRVGTSGYSMSFMAIWVVLLVGAIGAPFSRADVTSFATYPPGCATVPDVQTALYGENAAKFYEGRMALVNARNTAEKLDAIVAAYRVACAESNRSVIWLSFTIPPELEASTLYHMPKISFLLQDGWRPYASLSREPGGTFVTEPISPIIGNTEILPSLGGNTRTWVYILDLHPSTSWWDRPVSPEEYNGRFKLQFYLANSTGKKILEIAVPSTAELLSRNNSLPLNGRLSGNWVVNGAVDQGFVLAISELVPEAIPQPDKIAQSPLLVFVSWYTFDGGGKPLWLTGSVPILPGETEAVLDIDLVSGGRFLSPDHATRTQAGSLRLRAISCGRIDIEYDLSAIGLGAGKKQMQRLFALEIFGFRCSGGTGLNAEAES